MMMLRSALPEDTETSSFKRSSNEYIVSQIYKSLSDWSCPQNKSFQPPSLFHCYILMCLMVQIKPVLEYAQQPNSVVGVYMTTEF